MILPGMPEATIFALMLGSLWFIFSLFFIHTEITHRLKIFSCFIAANTFALALSAIQSFPFLEFLKISFNSHSSLVGLSSIPFGTIASVFYPYLFNPLYGWVSCFYYLGIATIILFLLTLFSIRNFGKKEKLIIGFFGLFAILMLAKIFGSSFINWIGYFPILNTLIFPKYAAPEIIFSFALVVAFGYSLLIRKKISFFNTKMALIFLGTIFLTLFSVQQYMPSIINRISETDPLAKTILVHLISHFHLTFPTSFIDTISTSLTFPFLISVVLAGFFIFLFLLDRYPKREQGNSPCHHHPHLYNSRAICLCSSAPKSGFVMTLSRRHLT